MQTLILTASHPETLQCPQLQTWKGLAASTTPTDPGTANVPPFKIRHFSGVFIFLIFLLSLCKEQKPILVLTQQSTT